MQARPSASPASEYTVRPGDSLSKVAARTQVSGISLDQMLVGLFRNNPDAFIDGNMNLLKAGA
ncbi:FimV/HubP family polar landmark protein, partial [Klebsiella pneumoniae]|uniref:FimV/HubP family polar landmark protein n=1 Tax=Klebsiella pneumoniae TaxID=573 RepID=UPI0027320A7F